MNTPPRKLLDQVHDAIQVKHYSDRTEKTYVDGDADQLPPRDAPANDK